MPPDSAPETSPKARSVPALGGAVWTPLMMAIPALLIVWMRLDLEIPICDDAFITLSAVRNLAEGEGLWFDPRQKVQIVTGPLWALPIAVLRAMGADVVRAAQLMGALFDVSMVLAVVALGRRLTGLAGMGAIAAVLVVQNPYVTMLGSFRGMETSLSLAVISLAFLSLLKGRDALALVLGVLAVMARFDGLLALGIVGLVWLYRRRSALFTRASLQQLLPAGALALTYLSATWLATGDVVPWSVRRKAAIAAPKMFSSLWLERAELLGTKFGQAAVGLVPYHTRYDPPSDWTQLGIDLAYVLTIPLLIGAVAAVWKKNRGVGLIAVYTLLFSAAFISSGRAYATNFPWYFAPAALGAAIVAAYGLATPIEWLGKRFFSSRSRGAAELGCLVIVLGLGFAQHGRVDHSGTVIRKVASAREGGYATAAVWFGKHLPPDAWLVTNEIGTVGFWARPGHELLDPFGLSRRADERKEPFGVLLERHQPKGAIIAKQFAYHMKTMDKRAPGAYKWHRWRGLHLGIRSDLAPELLETVGELDEIHADLPLDEEYPWASAED